MRFTPTGTGSLRSFSTLPLRHTLSKWRCQPYCESSLPTSSQSLVVSPTSSRLTPVMGSVMEWTCGCIVSCPVHSVGSRVLLCFLSSSIRYTEELLLYLGFKSSQAITHTLRFPWSTGLTPCRRTTYANNNLCCADNIVVFAALRSYADPSGEFEFNDIGVQPFRSR